MSVSEKFTDQPGIEPGTFRLLQGESERSTTDLWKIITKNSDVL